MNANGMARGYIAKQGTTERLTRHFKKTIQSVLEEYEEDYEFKVEQDRFIIVASGTSYDVNLPVHRIYELKQKGPYALDRYFWRQLEAQGFPVKKDDHYMQTVNP
ncbi:hypothetical protein [Halobacillus andaensis]|uniref:hypothetical protein n=1 Tax=Halobacillus andaensis TaxID=1176239 RepID=UPI003D75BA4F